MRAATFALAILLVAAGPTAAGTLPASAYAEVNEKPVEGYVLPRVKNLSARFTALQSEADRFCAVPSPAGMDTPVGRFPSAFAAWIAVSHLTFRPLFLLLPTTRLPFPHHQAH